MIFWASIQSNSANFGDRVLKFDMLVLCVILKRNRVGILNFLPVAEKLIFLEKNFEILKNLENFFFEN